MSTSDSLVVIREYPNEATASIDAGLLSSRGIRCIINNGIMSAVLPLGNSDVSQVQLIVGVDDYDRANDILNNPNAE